MTPQEPRTFEELIQRLKKHFDGDEFEAEQMLMAGAEACQEEGPHYYDWDLRRWIRKQMTH